MLLLLVLSVEKILSSSVSSRRREPPSKIKKASAVLKSAMATRHGGWGKRDGGTKSKSQWLASPVGDNAQSSQDQWMNSTNKSDGKRFLDIERKISHLGTKAVKKVPKDKVTY